jgi:hypothetical protein
LSSYFKYVFLLLAEKGTNASLYSCAGLERTTRVLKAASILLKHTDQSCRETYALAFGTIVRVLVDSGVGKGLPFPVFALIIRLH